MTVSDTTTVQDGIRRRKKTVAYKDAFYTVSFSCPVNKVERYRHYEGEIFGTFPIFNRFFAKTGMMTNR